MYGINLNKKIDYKYSSLRFFEENEHHVNRFCKEDVLVLVYDGILRFTEDDIAYEIYPGKYHIQKHDSYQYGYLSSSSPKYLYVHFYATWENSEENILAKSGDFDYGELKELMEKLDNICHCEHPYIQQVATFYEIIYLLYKKADIKSDASRIENFISNNYMNGFTLQTLAEKFNFSKNHIINIFKKKYNATPFEYLNFVRIKKAEYLLEVTSKTAECISFECGFNDYAYFYKVFYKKNGISPKKWRNKKRIYPYFQSICEE